MKISITVPGEPRPWVGWHKPRLTWQVAEALERAQVTCRGVAWQFCLMVAYQEAVQASAWVAMRDQALLTGAVKLTIAFHTNNKRPDLTNFFKACEDALQGLCFKNDRQVRESHGYVAATNRSPHTFIAIESLEDA